MNVKLWRLRIRKVQAALRTSAGRKALRHGVVPTIEHLALLKSISPVVVVDVGANRGQFSLSCRAANRRVRIIAFEPLPSAADVFEVVHRDANATVHRLALGRSNGVTDLNVAHHDDSSSLLKSVHGTGPTSIVTTLPVVVRRLDDVALDFEHDGRCLLKLDVQGGEADVLAGAARSLARFSDVLVEVGFERNYEDQASSTEIVTILGTHGFQLAGISAVSFDRDRIVQADLWFSRLQVSSTEDPGSS